MVSSDDEEEDVIMISDEESEGDDNVFRPPAAKNLKEMTMFFPLAALILFSHPPLRRI